MGFTIASVMPAKKPAQNAFGKRLVALHQQRGLTQVQLAKATGMTQRAISYYETEAELPASAALITLAKVLEVSADELLGLKQPKPGKAELRTPDPETERLWKRFQRMASLAERDQRAVIRLINSLSTTNGSGRTAVEARS